MQPLAAKTIGKMGYALTLEIIPGTRRTIDRVPVPRVHVAARFAGFSIRFIRSPILEEWNRVIRPEKRLGVRLPSESDPNLFKRWIALVNELEYKLVFFEAIYLN